MLTEYGQNTDRIQTKHPDIQADVFQGVVLLTDTKKKELKKMVGRIEEEACRKKATVAMGIRHPTAETIDCAKRAVERGYADIILVGSRAEILEAAGPLFKCGPAGDPAVPFRICDTTDPEKQLRSLLVDGKVDAAIRGTANASTVLSCLKRSCGVDRIHRISILSAGKSPDGMPTPFFFAPVGIDEGMTMEDKAEFIRLGASLIERLGVCPCIGLLSKEGTPCVEENRAMIRLFAEENPRLRITDYGMNLEKAVRRSNFILAPDGICGNLIFRALTFLGGGDGFGAPILMEDHVFVDTSRSAGHYIKAIMVASALSRERRYDLFFVRDLP